MTIATEYGTDLGRLIDDHTDYAIFGHRDGAGYRARRRAAGGCVGTYLDGTTLDDLAEVIRRDRERLAELADALGAAREYMADRDVFRG